MADAKRKKRFFEVEIPLIKKIIFLIGYSIEDLQGRQFDYDLTRILRGKNSLLKIKINVKDEKAEGKSIGIQLVPSYFRRMIRKGTNYVEDSFSAETKDSFVRIKPLLVTRRKVPRSVRKSLREKAKENIKNYAKEKNSEEIIEELLHGVFQKQLSLKLKKIYPLSFCDLRIFMVEKFK